MRKARKFHTENADSFPVLLESMGGGRSWGAPPPPPPYTHTHTHTHRGRVKTNIFKEFQIFIRASQSQLY